MPSTIPDKSSTRAKAGWPLVRLGDYSVKIGSGSTPRGGEAVYVKNGVPLIRSMNVHFDGLRPDGLAFITKDQAEKLKNVAVREGDVLLNITGASIGRVTTVPGELAGGRVNQHVCIIRPTSALLPKFVAYFFASPGEQMRISQCQVGATRQALTKQMIEDWQVPLPPLEEQQQTVAEIEKQFTRLEVGLGALHRVQANLKRYRSAVLKAACKGCLVPTEATLARRERRKYEPACDLIARTEAPPRPSRWNSRTKDVIPGHPALAVGNPKGNLPEGWAWSALVEIAKMESGHTPSRSHSEWWDGDVAWIGIADARDHHGRTIHETFQHTNLEGIANSASRLLPAGTVCVSRTASVGYVVVMGREMATSQDFVNWVPTPAVKSEWLRVVFSADREALGRFGKGSVHKTIYFPEWLAMHIAVPPLAEQTRIVAEVERRLSVAKEIEVVVLGNLKRGQRLRASILASGFSSERLTELRSLQEKKNPTSDDQTARGVNSIIFPMKKQVKLTPESLVDAVMRNKKKITPSDLCLASNVEEEVEEFFEVLRECRDRGLLVVPSGPSATITLAKS